MKAANKYIFTDIDVVVFDDDASITSVFIAKEIRENHYGTKGHTLKDGDVVIDIGANVGLWSIYVAMRNPQAQFHALEGLDISYQNLVDNIHFNKTSNVTAYPLVVTGMNGTVPIAAPDRMTAAASTLYGNKPLAHHNLVESITVDSLWSRLGVTSCKVMKVNLEGGEYEAFFNCTTWSKIGFLSIEIHEIPNEAKDFGWTQDALEDHIRKNMPKGNFHIVRVAADPNPNPL
jgi:FkbM family methyltransferase